MDEQALIAKITSVEHVDRCEIKSGHGWVKVGVHACLGPGELVRNEQLRVELAHAIRGCVPECVETRGDNGLHVTPDGKLILWSWII